MAVQHLNEITMLVTPNGANLYLEESMIRQTHDHRMFRLDPANRPIDPRRVGALTNAIRQKNLLHLFPIVVTTDFRVIDGQHRLSAATILGVPIYYVVSTEMQIEDAASANANTSHWHNQDFLHHHCALGNPEYLKLRDFHSRHQWLPLSTAMVFCHFGTSRDVKGMFERGQYVANDIPFAERVCAMAKDFSTWLKFWSDTVFVRAVHMLASNSDYDHRRMMRKMAYLSTRLVRCATGEDYLSVINAIYNYKVKESDKVVLQKLNVRNAKYRADRKNNRNQ